MQERISGSIIPLLAMVGLNDIGVHKFIFEHGGIFSLGDGINIRGTDPTIHFNDITSGEKEASIHVNNNKFYVLGHNSTNNDSHGGGWDKVGSYWPLQIDLDSDNINLGGHTHVREGFLHFGARTDQLINLYNSEYGIGVQSGTQYFRTVHNFAWYRGGSHNDNALNGGGGTPDMVLTSGNLGIGTTTPDAKLLLGNIGENNGVKLLGFGEVATSGFWFESGFQPYGGDNFVTF